jgi:RNA polymerase sigma-70 factor (sigma-E family)
MLTDVEFAAMFSGRATALRRTAYLLCGDWHRAEDLAQTAFAKCYAAWGRLREPAAADAYLRSTLLHAYFDDDKRAWRRRERVTGHLPEAPGTPSDPLEDRMVMLQALAAVPPRQRACLVLRFYDDLSVEETATALDCSVGTVKSNTSRGLDALRRALGDAAPDLVPTGGNSR